MAHIRIVDEKQARGDVADDYAFLSESYSKMLGQGTPAPQVYRTNSIVPAYFRFGAIQNRAWPMMVGTTPKKVLSLGS